MPIARVQLSDGRVARFEVPEGTPPEEVERLAAQIENQQTDGQELSPVDTADMPERRTPIVTSLDDLAGLEGEERMEAIRQLGRQQGQQEGALGASTTGVGSGLAGLGTLAGAAGNFVGSQARRLFPGEQEGLSFDEALELERARVGGSREENPAAFTTGAVGGGAALGGVGGRALSATAQGTGGAARLARAAQLRQGETLANTGRLVGTGAAAGGAEEASRAAIEGDDVGESAAFGATIGGLAGPATTFAAGGATRLAQNIGDSLEPGARVLRRASRETGDEGRRNIAGELRRRAEEFRQATGRGPRLSEIVDEAEAGQLRSVADARPEAAVRLNQGRQAVRAERQQTLPGAFRGGRTTTTPGAEEARRTASIDRQFAEFGDRPVALTTRVKQFLQSEDLRDALPQSLRRRIGQALDEETTLTVRDFDNIRQALRGRAGPGESFRFNQLADEARQLASGQVPELETALREQARRGEVISGLEEGPQVLRRGQTEQFQEGLERASPAQRAGTRVGARGAIVGEAGESPQSAENISRRIAEESGIQRRLESVAGLGEAQQLRRTAGAEAQSARNLDIAATDEAAALASTADINALSRLLPRVGAVASGRASGGFIAAFAEDLTNQFRIPPVAARRLAEAATDPQRLDEAIDVLGRMGLSEDALTTIRQAALIGGSTVPQADTGAAAGERNQRPRQ